MIIENRPAPSNHAAARRAPELDPRVFTVLRESADGADRMLCQHNASAKLGRVRLVPRSVELTSFSSQWILVLTVLR